MSAAAQCPEVPTVVLEPTEEAARLARGFLADRFAEWGLKEDYVARVVVSELVTNAYRHGEGAIVVRLFLDARDGLPILEVWDAGEGRPVAKPPNHAALTGRGLQIVTDDGRGVGRPPAQRGRKSRLGQAERLTMPEHRTTLLLLRHMFPHWSITLDGGIWRATGRILISSSHLEGLLDLLHAADPDGVRRAAELLEEP